MSTYILKPDTIPQILDITEHMAACHGFDIKEAMRLRLLCEEMITSIYSGIALAPGKLRFGILDGMFTVTASASAEVRGIPREERKKLLNTFKPPKRSGFFGFIQDYMEEMALSDGEMSFNGYMGMHYYGYIGMMNSMSHYTLDMDGIRKLAPISAPERKQTENDKEQEMEIKLLKGLADDIRVIDKRGTLEMTVMKKIPSGFLERYLLSE